MTTTFTITTTYGRPLTLDNLRAFVAQTSHLEGDASVNVEVHNNPMEPYEVRVSAHGRAAGK